MDWALACMEGSMAYPAKEVDPKLEVLGGEAFPCKMEEAPEESHA